MKLTGKGKSPPTCGECEKVSGEEWFTSEWSLACLYPVGDVWNSLRTLGLHSCCHSKHTFSLHYNFRKWQKPKQRFPEGIEPKLNLQVFI